jgi:hypothetical protein
MYVLSFISLYFLFYVRMEIEEINLYFSLNMIVLCMIALNITSILSWTSKKLRTLYCPVSPLASTM